MAQFVEDTDEDFFDKLVIDDNDNDLDDVNDKALANLSVSDLGKLGIKDDLENKHNGIEGTDAEPLATFSVSDLGTESGKLGTKDLSISDLGSGIEDSGKFGTGDDPTENENQNNGIGGTKPPTLSSKEDIHSHDGELLANLSVSDLGTSIEGLGKSGTKDYTTEIENLNNGIGGTAAAGVKQVQWSDFGSGSYPDFFNEFGDDSVDHIGNEDNFVSSESKGIADDSLQVNNVDDYSQQVGQSDLGTDSADPKSSQYWENLYPGWRYDANTCQWYQVDESYNETSYAQVVDNVNADATSDWTASNPKPEVSYVHQSFVESVAETVKTKDATNWNSVTQSIRNPSLSNWSSQDISKEYPAHMVFDPQYPGWYYDMNVQEWCSLDDYNSKSTVVAQDPVNQNEFGQSNTHYKHDQKTYNGQEQDYNWNGSSTTWQPNAVVNDHSKSTVVAQDLVNQNEFGQCNTYYKHDHKTYNAQEHYYWNGSSTTWQPNVVNNNSKSTVVAQDPVNQNEFGQRNTHYKHEQKAYNGQEQHYNWNGSSTTWQPNIVDNNAPIEDFKNSQHVANHVNQQQFNNGFAAFSGSQSFVPYNQPLEQSETMNGQTAYDNQNQLSYLPQPVQSGQHMSHGSSAGRSSAGCPPHALVAFGFGGKLIVMKDSSDFMNASYGGQESNSGSISVLNLAEVVTRGTDVHDYFHTLSQHQFPGPLSGGNVGSKELNKWIDDRITHSETSDMDHNKGGVQRLLLSLLKIASQHYGKFRSPFGSDAGLKESDAPEVAVARLFASVKNTAEYNNHGAFGHCLQQVPSEVQTQETAAEVQTLLVSGKKKEALMRAQEGHLWGPALVLAAQLGDQFYVDTAKKMALAQFVSGSPLRTLCLLIAGQPADVFATDAMTDGAVNMFQQPTRAQSSVNSMLDDWKDNLAVITANRTDDELVLIHLGDCLWKERSDIIAAHICYLVAETNFEPYSDSARMCLIGVDHWNHPRTYASPEAIQRTEVYEYSKVLGNSQFMLLPFQPYKLIYAHMLAEVGRVADSLKYCQAITKSLKTGRIPEVETWRQLVISLEDRIKIHQQGGFSTNLAPGKIVGKLLNLFDSSAHRVVGGTTPPVTSTSSSTMQNNHQQPPQKGLRFFTSQSTMAMSSLVTSPSMEQINQADGNRRMMHSRSASEPDFSRSTNQDQDDLLKENSTDSQRKGSGNTSRFGRFAFGSGILQKTVSMVLKPRNDKQAKLGDTNKFYYDEKLKRWVEEGVDSPAEESTLAPPPTMATFQNGSPDYSLKTALRTESMTNGNSEFASPSPASHTSGIPLIPPTTNQFSARGRTGVRARYVDTFNKGGGNATNLFQPPSVPPIKPKMGPTPNPNFFVPTAAPASEQTAADIIPDNQTPMVSSGTNQSAMGLQKFASMDDISKGGLLSSSTSTSSFSYDHMSRRTSSWSGGLNQDLSVSGTGSEQKAVGGMNQHMFMLRGTGFTHSSNDDLLEVEF
ncbi:protein transport protein SEC16A homolog [Bidens hawaiensis]|uniref:protein transport protein SEC16A homolog n=1 Tax=Bidens hawaiensis TaxID=980011 RepID=UPI00404B5C86